MACRQATPGPGAERDDVLAQLVRLRLVREFERGGVALYELAHDHVARKIAASISDEEMAAKAVRELLRREVESWQRHGLLIAPEALRLIHEQREALRRLSAARWSCSSALRWRTAMRCLLVRACLPGRRGGGRHRPGGPAKRQLPHPCRGRDRAGAVGRALRR